MFWKTRLTLIIWRPDEKSQIKHRGYLDKLCIEIWSRTDSIFMFQTLRVYVSQTCGDCHNNKMTIRATFALHNNRIAILKLKTNRQAPNDKRVQFEEDFACCFFSIAYNLTLILYLRRSGSVCFGVRLRPVCCVSAVESLYRITDPARYYPQSLRAQRTTHGAKIYNTYVR